MYLYLCRLNFLSSFSSLFYFFRYVVTVYNDPKKIKHSYEQCTHQPKIPSRNLFGNHILEMACSPCLKAFSNKIQDTILHEAQENGKKCNINGYQSSSLKLSIRLEYLWIVIRSLMQHRLRK